MSRIASSLKKSLSKSIVGLYHFIVIGVGALMIRGRYLYFLALLTASTAYSEGMAPGQQMYYSPQQSSGYGMYGAQQSCGSAPRTVPRGIKELQRNGSDLERKQSQLEREINKLQSKKL